LALAIFGFVSDRFRNNLTILQTADCHRMMTVSEQLTIFTVVCFTVCRCRNTPILFPMIFDIMIYDMLYLLRGICQESAAHLGWFDHSFILYSFDGIAIFGGSARYKFDAALKTYHWCHSLTNGVMLFMYVDSR